MTKPFQILVIGDSHCGAFKRGWDRIAPDYPDRELVFFAGRGKTLSSLCHRDGDLTVTNAETARALKRLHGYDSLDLSSIDFAICVGMFDATPLLGGMQARHRPASFSGEAAQYLSHHAYQCAWRERLTRSLLGHVIETLRSAGISRGITTLVPFRSSAIASQAGGASDRVRTIISDGEGSMLRSLLQNCMSAALPTGYIYESPPDSLTVHGVFTKAQFSEGSTRLVEAIGTHDPDDVAHMNDDYGEIYLRHILDSLGSVLTSIEGRLSHDPNHTPL